MCRVPLAEMIAAWNAIKGAILHGGVTKLWVEGALGTVLAIKKGSNVDSYTANLLQDINSWLQMHDNQRVSHILCEGNSPADFMTVVGSKRIAVE